MNPKGNARGGVLRWPEGVDSSSAVWLALMSLMLFALLLPFSSYVAALPLIQREWGLNNTQAGAIYSAYLAGYALSALLIIPLTDRVGPKYIFFASIMVSVVAHALFPLAAYGMTSAVVLRAVAGVGLVGIYMPGLRMISERFSEGGRGMAMGLFVTAFYGATAVSLAATGGLMAALEWRDAYLIMALAGGVSLPIAYFLLRNHDHVQQAQSSGRLDLGVLRDPRTRAFILGYTLHAAELYVARIWLPAFLTAILVARGIDSAQAAVTAATVGGIALAAGSVGPVMGGIMSDRWGRAPSAAAIFALSGACSLLIGWIGDFPLGIVVAVAVVYGWSIAADSSIYSTAVTEIADSDRLGSTMAVQAFLGFTGGFIGPIVVGGILDVAPESLKWGIGFSFVGLLAVAALVVLMRMPAETSVARAGVAGVPRSGE